MRRFETAVLALLLAAAPLLGGNPKECLDLAVTRDSDINSPSGIRVTITGRNLCSEDLDGSRCWFKVTVLSSDGVAIAKQSGRFGGTIAPRGNVETKVFILCDPDRVRSLKVEAE